MRVSLRFPPLTFAARCQPDEVDALPAHAVHLDGDDGFRARPDRWFGCSCWPAGRQRAGDHASPSRRNGCKHNIAAAASSGVPVASEVSVGHRPPHCARREPGLT
jgi:hypothetical protein